MRVATTVLALLLAGCPDDVSFPPGGDAGVPPGEGIELHGRVVDFESCPIPPGCAPVEGVIVEVDGARTESAPTGREGAFVVYDAPKDTPLSLTVRGNGRYATTIAAALVPGDDDDIFDIRLYAMPRGPQTLLEGIELERGTDLEDSGGYIGQAVAQIDPEGDPLCPDLDEGLCAIEDVVASVRPAGYGVVAYVNGLPSFVPDGPVILPEGHATTSTGIFIVLPGSPDYAVLDVVPTHPDLRLPTLTAAPVEPGAVTLGFHRAD